jgi:hypothetical protein
MKLYQHWHSWWFWRYQKQRRYRANCAYNLHKPGHVYVGERKIKYANITSGY